MLYALYSGFAPLELSNRHLQLPGTSLNNFQKLFIDENHRECLLLNKIISFQGLQSS
nr:MAG TPA: hypothetical protein [Caudoviricetes sp.]